MRRFTGASSRGRSSCSSPRAPTGAHRHFWWQDLILAKRAEALILAGDRGAAEAVALADSRPTADAHAATVTLRARGLLESDDSVLGEACDRFAEFGQIPELARTRWLLGGDERLEAERAFERLGTVRPVAGLGAGAARPRAGARPGSRSAARRASAFDSTSGRNAHAVIPWQLSSVSATTVAERGPLSISAISPK